MKIAVTILQLLSALVLILIVLFQSGKSQGLSGAIGGIADSYMSRSKARSVDAKLAKATKWVGAIFVILTLVLNCMSPPVCKIYCLKEGPRSIASGTFFCPFFSLGSSVQMPGLGSLPPESKQLLHGDEFHPLLRQTVNGLQGRLHAGSVAVVQQDHIPVPRLTDGGEHLLHIPTLPVAGIHRPVQHGRAPCPPAPPR